MRILCYGDSNTYGWDPRDYLGIPYSRTWPVVLAERTGADVISMGEPGREIPEAQGRAFLLSSLAKEQPDVLMILLGTNDLLLHPNRPAEEIARNMDALICGVRNHFPEMTVILMSPPRMAEDMEPRPGALRQLAEAYAGIASRYDDGKVAFFDTAALVLPLSFDGIHLTEEGHRMLAEETAVLFPVPKDRVL